MTFAPRSCPSRPGLAMTTRVFRIGITLDRPGCLQSRSDTDCKLVPSRPAGQAAAGFAIALRPPPRHRSGLTRLTAFPRTRPTPPAARRTSRRPSHTRARHRAARTSCSRCPRQRARSASSAARDAARRRARLRPRPAAPVWRVGRRFVDVENRIGGSFVCDEVVHADDELLAALDGLLEPVGALRDLALRVTRVRSPPPCRPCGRSCRSTPARLSSMSRVRRSTK